MEGETARGEIFPEEAVIAKYGNQDSLYLNSLGVLIPILSNYVCEYVPSWINCIDESMNSFLNMFCPGFMCVPRKPHPFGNKYHSIADGVTGKGLEGGPIMWRVKLQEGKYFPKKP